MSDDTPTESFDPAGDAPTERLPANEDAAPEEVVEERKSRKLILILGIVGGALLLAVIVLLALLLTRGLGTGGEPTAAPTPTASASPTPSPTASATPSPTPTPTPTPTETQAPPPPPPSGPDGRIVSFSGPNSPGCYSPDAPAYQGTVPITFTWVTENVSEVAFGVDTADAIYGSYASGLPPSGSLEIDFTCGDSMHTYTLTVKGADGIHVSKTVTVNNPAANN